MVKAIVSDVSKVLLFTKDENYKGSLNGLYRENKNKEGFRFFDYFRFNTELLDYYNKISGNLDLYIFTRDIIQKDPELQKYWQKVFKNIIGI